MRTASAKFRFASWLAIAAMALNALWPLLANAQPAGQASMFEVCTAEGIKFVPGDAGKAPAESGAKHLQPHCALCSFGADKVPAVTQVAFVIPAVLDSSGGPSPFDVFSPVRPDIRSPAQPRAPPVLS